MQRYPGSIAPCDHSALPSQLIHDVSQSQLSPVINDAVSNEVDETQSHFQPAIVKEEPNDVCYVIHPYSIRYSFCSSLITNKFFGTGLLIS